MTECRHARRPDVTARQPDSGQQPAASSQQRARTVPAQSTGDGKVAGEGGEGETMHRHATRALHLHRYLALHTAAATLRVPTHSQSAVAARREQGEEK